MNSTKLPDAMLHPAFPADEVKKLAAQRVDGIKSAKDRAAGVMFVGFGLRLAMSDNKP